VSLLIRCCIEWGAIAPSTHEQWQGSGLDQQVEEWA